MCAQGKSLTTDEIRVLVIENEQNCRLYLHKISNLKETLDAQDEEIKTLNTESLRHEADIIMMEKEIASLRELVQKKTLILKEEKCKLDELQSTVWAEREQFGKKIANYKYFETESNKHDVQKINTERDTMNEELASLEGQVNALRSYVAYTNTAISSLQSEMDTLSSKKAHLVERCLS